MNRQRTQYRQQPHDPNWRRPAADPSRCAKSPDGRHRWITTYRREGRVETLQYPVCDACLEIDEREVAAA